MKERRERAASSTLHFIAKWECTQQGAQAALWSSGPCSNQFMKREGFGGGQRPVGILVRNTHNKRWGVRGAVYVLGSTGRA
jgi:hypothetical protein